MFYDRDCRRQRGQALVNALVGIVITGVLAVTVASILAAQSKENRALSEKMASLDLQRSVISTLSSATACNAIFAATNIAAPASNNAGGGGGNGAGQQAGNGLGGLVSGVGKAVADIVKAALTFNLNLIDPKNPHVFSVQNVPGIGGSSAVISAGERVSALSNSLYVLPSNAPTPGIQMLVTGASTAILRINFDQSKLVHPIRSLEFPLNIQTSGTPTQTTIDGCSFTNTPSQWQCLSMGGDWFTPGSLNCVRIVDGMSCKLGSNSNGFFGSHTRSSNWNCVSAGTAWPGGGPWACSVATSSGMMLGMPNGQPACVRTSDGMLCTLTTHFDFWTNRSTSPKWKCISGGGWPM